MQCENNRPSQTSANAENDASLRVSVWRAAHADVDGRTNVPYRRQRRGRACFAMPKSAVYERQWRDKKMMHGATSSAR